MRQDLANPGVDFRCQVRFPKLTIILGTNRSDSKFKEYVQVYMDRVRVDEWWRSFFPFFGVLTSIDERAAAVR